MINEFDYIQNQQGTWYKNLSTKIGIGDDAAQVAVSSGNLVISTDTLVENQHFKLAWSTPEQIAARGVIQTLADIYAMGAKPISLLLSVGCNSIFFQNNFSRLIDSVVKTAQNFQVDLIGGDTVKSRELFISLTALGTVTHQSIRTLGEIRARDVIAISGPLGASAAGLDLLESQYPTDDLVHFDALIDLYKVPILNLVALSEIETVPRVALTDISDGLVKELYTMLGRASLRINLDVSSFPTLKELSLAGKLLAKDPLEWQLYGGEDHVFLISIPEKEIKKLTNWYPIGRIEKTLPENAGVFYQQRKLPSRGWDAFTGYQ